MRKRRLFFLLAAELTFGVLGPVRGQIPGFNFVENPLRNQAALALEHWSAGDALSVSFTSPIPNKMYVRLAATGVHSTRKNQVLWGHSIRWGDQDLCVLSGGFRRQRFLADASPLWSFVWRFESRISEKKVAWQPFIEWSSFLRKSREQALSDLRFGTRIFRQLPMGELQAFCQWISPSWTFNIQYSRQFQDRLSVGITAQFQPRLWGLNCKFRLDGWTTQCGLAPVSFGGWRSRLAITRNEVFQR